MLFQSGAFTLSQLFKQNTISIKQSELQSLVEFKNQSEFLLCFERNNLFHHFRVNKELNSHILCENKSLIAPTSKLPWKFFKHIYSPAFILMGAMIPAMVLSSFFTPALLKTFFLSEKCHSTCAKIIGDITYSFSFSYLLILGTPLFYFLGIHIASKFFELKLNRPAAVIIPFFALAVSITHTNYEFLKKPQVKFIFSNWKNGTLNKETIAQYNLKYKRLRTAETKDSQTEE